MEKLLQKKRDLAAAILCGDKKCLELTLDMFLGEDEDTNMLFSILFSYIEIQRLELASELLPIDKKKQSADEIYTRSLEYLRSVRECKEEIDIKAKEKVIRIIESAIDELPIKREDKIFIMQQQSQISQKIDESPDVELLLIYSALDLAGKMERKREERKILSYIPSKKEQKQDKTPIYVQKINDISGAIRVTGKTTQEEIKKMLHRRNSATMSVEEYGEQILASLKEQGVDINAFPAAENKNEDSADSESEETNKNASSEDKHKFNNKDSIYSNSEEKRRKKEKEEYINYGDGNRKGRK